MNLHVGGHRSRIRGAMEERPLRLVSEMIALGVTRSALASAEAAGEIVRVAWGVVATPEAEDDANLQDAVISIMTGGIIAHRSAAVRHALTDDMPDKVEIIVPEGQTRAPGSLPVRLIRSRQAASFSVGVETSQVLGVDVRMTNPARTVVDHYRIGTIRQHALQALQGFLGQSGDEGSLLGMAMPFDLDGRLVPMLSNDIESFLLARSSGYGG